MNRKHSFSIRRFKLLYSQRLLLRDAYEQWGIDMRPTHEVTFNFETRITPASADAKMMRLCKWAEERGLGRRWSSKSADRLVVLGFPENMDSNTHWHCVAQASDLVRRGLYDAKVECWPKLAPRGHLHVERINDLESAASYFTKNLYLPNHVEEVFVYRGKPGRGQIDQRE
jgi:hypothetical protein